MKSQSYKNPGKQKFSELVSRVTKASGTTRNIFKYNF